MIIDCYVHMNIGKGYDIEDNLIFGTDCNVEYDADYAKHIMAMDKEAFDLNNVSQEKRGKYFYKNTLRFLGQV